MCCTMGYLKDVYSKSIVLYIGNGCGARDGRVWTILRFSGWLDGKIPVSGLLKTGENKVF